VVVVEHGVDVLAVIRYDSMEDTYTIVGEYDAAVLSKSTSKPLRSCGRVFYTKKIHSPTPILEKEGYKDFTKIPQFNKTEVQLLQFIKLWNCISSDVSLQNFSAPHKTILPFRSSTILILSRSCSIA